MPSYVNLKLGRCYKIRLSDDHGFLAAFFQCLGEAGESQESLVDPLLPLWFPVKTL